MIVYQKLLDKISKLEGQKLFSFHARQLHKLLLEVPHMHERILDDIAHFAGSESEEYEVAREIIELAKDPNKKQQVEVLAKKYFEKMIKYVDIIDNVA